MTINCRGKLIDLSSPKVMGILNLTLDSFYDGGKLTGDTEILSRVDKMLAEGADIIDIGGMSSRPGAKLISEKEELRRVLSPVKNIIREFPEAIISIDTIHSGVAKKTLDAGAHIINDISAGRFDKKMIKTLAAYKAPFVIMHLKGMPADMQKKPVYKNVVTEVLDFFMNRVEVCRQASIQDTIIDPGFGFGKSIEHNYQLLRNLRYFSHLNLPILSGVSRKSMICKVLGVNPDKALNGTTAANTIALMNGASILRVHDVKEAKEVIKIFERFRNLPGKVYDK